MKPLCQRPTRETTGGQNLDTTVDSFSLRGIDVLHRTCVARDMWKGTHVFTFALVAWGEFG